MDLVLKENLIQKLSLLHEKNVPLTSDYLKSLGISYSLADFYRKSGWLDKISKGVYLFKNEKLTNYGVASDIVRRRNFHLGGRSALTLLGNIHYARNSERIDIFGLDKKYELPLWTKTFDIKYTTKSPFDDSLEADFCISKLDDAAYPTLILSERERAVLELIYCSGSLYDKDEVEKIVETLASLRSSKLKTLLSHCDSVRTLKECHRLTAKFDLPWLDVAAEIKDLKKIR